MYLTLARSAWSRRLEMAGAVMHWSGLGWAFEKACRPGGAIILMYHSVAPAELAPYIEPPNRISPQMFERQMAYLRRHRNVVPLSQLLATIAAGETPPARTVCLTFDDGYLDNLTVAAPILQRYELPATLYLATGYVTRSQAQWADELYCLVRQRTRDVLAIERLGLAVDWSVPGQAAAARRLLHARLLEANRAQRDELLDELRRQLQPAGTVPRLTLNWDECREMARRYPLFDLGGHTRDHLDLRTHRGESALSEITGCMEDLRRELHIEPRSFSFPYGRWCDETRGMVHDGGWKSAIGANLNYRIGHSTDRFAMARPETPESMTALKFKTSGAFPHTIKWLGLH